MKKACFLTILLFFCHICAASGEQLSFSWEIGPGENQESGTAQILLSDESIILTSSWLNDYAIIAGSDMMTDQNNPLFCIPQVLQHTAEYRDRLPEILKAWTDGLTSDLTYGYFAGDSFESASVELTSQITWADLSVLLNNIKESIPDLNPGNAFETMDSRIRELALKNHSGFLLKKYDNGDAFSLTAIRGGETIATCSADLSNPGRISAVIGWAENKKDYYFAAVVSPENNTLKWHADFLADDFGAGYRGIPSDGLILSIDGDIGIADDELTATTEIIPANGTGRLRTLFTVGKTTAGLELYYADEQNPLLVIQGKTEQENRDKLLMGKTILFQERMTAEEKNTLSGILIGHSIGLFYKLYNILPQEFITTLLPGM